LTSRMPESGKSGSVGARGGDSPGDPAISSTSLLRTYPFTSSTAVFNSGRALGRISVTLKVALIGYCNSRQNLSDFTRTLRILESVLSR
jgi:hypothetical protein